MPALDSLTILDFAVLAVLVLSALLSLLRGGVREALGLACWIGAAYVAMLFFDDVQPLVMEQLDNELFANMATAVGLFLVPLIVFKIIAGIIANAVSDGPLGGIDKLLGLVFGVARGALIVVLAWLFAGQIIPADKLPDWVSTAYSKPYLNEGAQWLRQYLPDGFLEDAEGAATTAIEGAETLQRLQGSEGATTPPADAGGTSSQ